MLNQKLYMEKVAGFNKTIGSTYARRIGTTTVSHRRLQETESDSIYLYTNGT